METGKRYDRKIKKIFKINFYVVGIIAKLTMILTNVMEERNERRYRKERVEKDGNGREKRRTDDNRKMIIKIIKTRDMNRKRKRSQMCREEK